MADVTTVIAANREAVNELVAASERCAAVWTTPRAPGKWAPSQIVEHVARSIEESANMMAGAPTKFVTLPFFLRPVARTLLFKRVLRSGGFRRPGRTRRWIRRAGLQRRPTRARGSRARLRSSIGNSALTHKRRIRSPVAPSGPYLWSTTHGSSKSTRVITVSRCRADSW